MRLIDLDKVRWKEGFYDMHTGEQFASMIFNTPEWLEWATAEAEVKAVPIEWIKKKSLEFLMNRNFRLATDFQEVIDMWKVENNIPLFDGELKITWEKENGVGESNRNI